MTTRITDNMIKGILIAILFVFLMLQTWAAQAQRSGYTEVNPYKGFVAGFGTRSASFSSSIQHLQSTNMVQAGGQVGVVYGNSVVRGKLNLLGYYSSTGKSAGTTDLYTTNAIVNFYPLACLSGTSFLIEPYITGSLDLDRYKFYGHYINREPGAVNYSRAEAPLLGKIRQVNATIGLGLEVKLKDAFDFVHVFSEVRYGTNFSSQTTAAAFADTQIKNQTQVKIGMSFGIHR